MSAFTRGREVTDLNPCNQSWKMPPKFRKRVGPLPNLPEGLGTQLPAISVVGRSGA